MPVKRRSSLRLMFCVVVLCSASALGQVTANLSGRVTDQTGAAITAASVTAINVDTQLSRSTTTSQSGLYQLVALPIGRYEIHASKSGFAEQVRTGIVLVVGQDATADLTLQVGQASASR